MELVTASGEKHGIINTIANSVKDTGFAHMTPEMKAKCEKQRKEEAKIVKARYLNSRGQNERLTKPYMRWAGDNIVTYHLIPGQDYDLPMGFIKEVNSSPGLAKRSEILDSSGQPTKVEGAAEKIHQLVPVGFN